MLKNRHSSIYIFLRATIIVNIILFSIGTAFFVIFNQSLLKVITDQTVLQLIKSNISMVVMVGVAIILVNIILFLALTIYSKRKYFRLLDAIDFDNIEGSLAILKKIHNLDEFGFLGKKIKNLIEMYINFSYLKKKRIVFEQNKTQFLLETVEEPALLLSREDNNNQMVINFLNENALKLLGFDKRSQLLGKKIEEILSDKSKESYLQSIENIKHKQEKITLNVILRGAVEKNELEIIVPSKSDDEEKRKPKTFSVQFFPFIFSWSDSSTEEDVSSFPENQNQMIDSLILILDEKQSSFWS